jgi:GNAT superfamily N-acetyltransferase
MEITNIRQADEGDIPRIIELYRDLTITSSEAERSRGSSLDDYQRVLAEIRAMPGHDLLVIQHQGEVVGTMVLLIVPNLSHSGCPWALAENLIIDRGYRRRGLGRMLMDYAISRAREAGCHKLVLTSDKRRRRAHQFYRSLGFRPSAHGFRLYF